MEQDPSSRSPEVIAEPRFEKLFGRADMYNHIEDGDEIGVGGSIFSNSLEIKMRIDEEKLEPLLAEVQRRIDALPPEEIGPWLSQSKIEIDPSVFVKLLSITITLGRLVQENPNRAAQRREAYYSAEGGASPAVDEFLNENIAECSEMAAFAQLALQRAGLDSKLVNGSVLFDEEWEFAEEHSFNYLSINGRQYVYDPANPVRTNWGEGQPQFLPRIMAAPEDFLDRLRDSSQKCFIECTGIYGNKPVFYGTDDGTPVINIHRQS